MPIDVALLGCAHPHVPDVLGVLAAEPDARLVAAWDSDPSAMPAAISGAAGRARRDGDRRANAVVVCAPTDERPALCVQAARAGRPVLVEQPVARTAAEARALARELARTPHAGDRRAVPARAARARAAWPACSRERMLGRLASVDGGVRPPGRARRPVRRPARVDARPRAGRRRRLRRPRAAARRRARDARARRAAALAAVALDRPRARARRRRRHRGRDVGGRAADAARGLGGAARRAGARVAGAAGTATLRDGVLELDRGGRRPSAGSARRRTPARRCARSPTRCARGACRATGSRRPCTPRSCSRRP